MKKIIFVINNMNVGGIQKSLLELIKNIYSKYDITLFCITLSGDYLKEIPECVNIMHGNQLVAISELPLREVKASGFFYMVLRAFLVSWSKIFGKKIPARIITRLMGKIEGNYDVAISYSQPIKNKSFCVLNNEIVLNCCNARRKITFLHCDFEKYGGNSAYNRSLYKKFDVIAAVSDSVKEKFTSINPGLADKIFTVRNCCDYNKVRLLANENPVAYSKPAIITVARLSVEKGLIRCITVMKRLKDVQIEYEWHIIGDGSLRNALCSEIKKENLEGHIFLHGEQINPYRYMKNASCFFLPSFHEAAPMVFDEARCLKIPILTTNTLSAEELVANRKIGIVCDNSVEGIFEMLKMALTQKIFLKFDYDHIDNKIALKQFAAVCKETIYGPTS